MGEQADSRSAPMRHQTETGSARSLHGAAGDWRLAGLKTQRTEPRRHWKWGWDAGCGAHSLGCCRVEQHQQ